MTPPDVDPASLRPLLSVRAGLALLGLLLPAACVDYGLFKPDEPEPGADGGADDDGGADSGSPGACGEPAVDVEVSVNESCMRDVEAAPLDPVEEWSVEVFPNYGESDQVVMAPVVGPLFDDNGDGVIDGSDRPSVVIITDDDGDIAGKHGIIRILDGNGGARQADLAQWEIDGLQIFPYRYSNVALGDINGDGRPDIVAMVELLGDSPGGDDGGGADTGPDQPGDDGGGDDGGDTDNPIFPTPPTLSSTAPPPEADMRCTPAAFSPEGDLQWLSEDVRMDCAGHAPALADLDGDGQVEVVVGRMVFAGDDGRLLAQGSYDEGRFYAYAEIGMHSVIADLDVDGVQEIIAGRSVYRPDGSLKCMGGGPVDGFAAVADFDGDGEGEFVVVGDGELTIYDTDCSSMRHWDLPDSGNGGPPAIGDLDGDGQPEIALPSASAYTAYEIDGSVIWSAEVSDVSSHATGSLIFDFESDGYPEVVYADELALHIYDGRTGELRYIDERHSSRTLHDYPTVADVDRDGVVEIIVPNGGGHYTSTQRGIYVLGSESGAWQAARPVWNQHAYSITNVANDLSIPADPEPNWLHHNNFRSGDPNPSEGGRWPDAVPVAQVCTAECDAGIVVIDVAIANQGAGSLRAEVPMFVWYENGSGHLNAIRLDWTGAIIEEGQLSEAIRLRLVADDIAAGTVYVGADLDDEMVGYADECDEGNNTLAVVEARCP